MILRQATTVKCGNPKRLKLGLASVHGWFIYYWGCNLLEPSAIVHILLYLSITFRIHPWGSITIHGDPWHSIMFHNLPAPSTRFYRLPWQSRRFHQVPWYSRRFQQWCWLICQKRKWMGCALTSPPSYGTLPSMCFPCVQSNSFLEEEISVKFS